MNRENKTDPAVNDAVDPDAPDFDAPAGETLDDAEPKTGEDARHDPEKLKRNRARLGVDEDHETPEMKKDHRGTFP